ncbi:outer membrane beta-barrel protein [Puia sp. P3]|uniref:outer membrane beta-barrel protein n=1 Tax=Puia sp. P3 TaxID=3423952 RepID=UPI003D66AC2B
MRKIVVVLLVFVSLCVRGQKKDSLAAVTVTGRKPLVERRLDKTVINVDQKLSASGETVLETLRGLPGVQVSPEGEVSLNGKPGVQVYLDGKPTFLSSEDLAALLNGMGASVVLRIEIMTNPPARYGATGTAGIINIVRKKNSAERFNGNVNGSWVAGYFPGYSGGVTGSYKNERVNISFGDGYNYSKTLFGQRATSELLDMNQQVSDNRRVATRRTDRPSAGIDWYLSPKTTLSLSGMAGFGEAGDEIGSVVDRKGAVVNHEDFVSRDRDRPSNYMSTLQVGATAGWEGRRVDCGPGLFGVLQPAGAGESGVVYDTSGRVTGDDDGVFSLRRRVRIFSAQADYVRPWSWGRMEAGWKSSRVGVDVEDTVQNDEKVDALYGQVYRSAGRLEIQGGVRVEWWRTGIGDRVGEEKLTRDYFQLFPSLFAGYKVDSSNSVVSRLGRRTEKPDYSEMIPLRRPLSATLFPGESLSASAADLAWGAGMVVEE